MSQFADMIDDASAKLFAPFATQDVWRAAERNEGFAAVWTAVEASGFLDLLCTDDSEAAEAGAAAFRLMRNAGRALLPAPVGETLVARAVLSHAGLKAPSGPLMLGRLRAPYGRYAQNAISVSGGEVHLHDISDVLEEDCNAAGEPRDTLALKTHVSAKTDWTPERLRAAGALVRASQMAGALERILMLTVDYARTRKQFGKSIGQFQAIQQQLALLAGQTASASVAAAHAFRRWDHHDFAMLAAAAKIRTGEAAAAAGSIAHQTHGAIGITYEHELHFATRRLHSWRTEYGRESEWAKILGAWACDRALKPVWDRITKS